ncbi:hypothetical protein Taro_046628 [Colocasia esculenta]|uniref:Enhancer of polycomb-like protein n=1 Tax=Colocasia esculenta TaxID=4460 RepID=A0A843WQH3_COLES|nr:hypothetical protein [Colocasia esculenta]
MENSEDQHDGVDTSEKTKSLDSHGLHEGKSEVSIRIARTGCDEFCVSNQTGPTEKESVAPGQSGSRSRRSTRSRRGIIPNAFQSVIKRCRGDSSISRSVTDGPDSGTGKAHDLNGSSSISSSSHGTNSVSNAPENGLAFPQAKRRKSTLGRDAQEVSTLCDDIDIPRRPRYVPRQNNSSLDIKRAPDLSKSIGRGSSAAHSSKLSSDLDTPTQPVGVLVGKRKRINGECKENGPGGWNSVRHCKQDNDSLVQVVQRRDRRNSGKRQSTATEKEKHLPGKPIVFAGSGKFRSNCHDDDEESLEQNAARMLSSRFDPRFTGLPGDKSRISSKSLSESLSYVPLIQERSNGSESVTSTLDIAGRVLRPRKQSDKGYVKKRRHFYEVCSRGVDPYWVLKRRIRVFWPLDQSWYLGLVKDYDPVTKLHLVKYDDRDEEWTNLQNERFKLLLLPSEFSRKFDSNEMELEAKPRNEDGTTSAVDDKCMDGILESEPIISWLARSAHRVKASSLKILKEKRLSHVNCLLHKSSRKPSLFVLPERCEDEKDTKMALMKTRKHCDDKKFVFVYSRRRFRKNVKTVQNKLEESSFWNFPNSLKHSAFSADDSEARTQSDVTFGALYPRKRMLRLLLPFHWVSNLAWLFKDSWLHERSLRKMSWKRFVHYLDPEISGNSSIRLPYFRLNGQNRSCPFSLPFCTVPALFLFLHLKLLLEKNVDFLRSKIPATPILPDYLSEIYGKFTDECHSPVEDSSDQFSETTHENLGSTLNHAVVGSRWLHCSHSKLETDAISLSNDGNWVMSSNTPLSNELNLNRSSAAVHRKLGENVCDEMESQFHKCPFTKSWQDVGNTGSPLLEDISSTEESEGGCGSFLNADDVKIQTSAMEAKVSHKRVQNSEKSTSYLTWNTNDCTIHSPNTTAPRTICYRNSRQSSISPSVVHHSNLWPEDWYRFVNGYKKPRTQVSYALPFGGYDMGSKSRSHHRKERSHRRSRNDNAKNALVGSKSVDNDLDSLTCDANVLVTAGDRGWRAHGAHVSLESDDQKDWQIAVKLSGAIKYSHKPQQFLQPGITNRYTHAMMWKGGKDWTLEFTDRSQWSLFKEMYAECYNRNVRAASVKNIPIPGVRLIEECDDCAIEVPFIHNCAKYFRQKGTEIDMALNPSHVLYDMDSEDEEWISYLRNSADDSGRMLQEISEEMFEKTMDMFEKAAFTQHCNEFTDADLERFMTEVGPLEVIKAVHQHWHQKRQKRDIPLIRQFQVCLLCDLLSLFSSGAA